MQDNHNAEALWIHLLICNWVAWSVSTVVFWRCVFVFFYCPEKLFGDLTISFSMSSRWSSIMRTSSRQKGHPGRRITNNIQRNNVFPVNDWENGGRTIIDAAQNIFNSACWRVVCHVNMLNYQRRWRVGPSRFRWPWRLSRFPCPKSRWGRHPWWRYSVGRVGRSLCVSVRKKDTRRGRNECPGEDEWVD